MVRVLKNNEDLLKAFNNYNDALAKVEERRILWDNETKNYIIETLNLIKSTFSLDCIIQRIEIMKNYQTINLHFKQKYSGIVEVIDSKGFKAYLKHGSYLAYSQSFNGLINVIIGFPYIDEIVEPMKVEVIATIEPEQITEKLICEHFIIFLDYISKWEGKKSEGKVIIPLGYKNYEDNDQEQIDDNN